MKPLDKNQVSVDQKTLIFIKEHIEEYFDALKSLSKSLENNLSYFNTWKDEDFESLKKVVESIGHISQTFTQENQAILNKLEKRIQLIDEYRSIHVEGSQ